MKKLSDELMLGDIFATLSGKPRRVTHNTCSTLALSSWQIDASNKPLPLDIPTLELNGFDFDMRPSYVRYTKKIKTEDGDKYSANITLDEKGKFCNVYILKNPDDPVKFKTLASVSNVLYVHQLQNLLRMCELADFANGFKVKGLDD